MKKYNKGEIAKIILKGLLAGGIVVTIIALPGLAQVYTLFKPKISREKYKINRSLRNLHRQKYIKINKRSKNNIIEITEKGKRRAIEYEFQNTKINKPNNWDGYWRIIIFDIPENIKKSRQALNIKLKNMGFYPLQKSTFLSPFPCKKEVDFVGNYFQVRKYIMYIKAKELDGAQKLKKHFNLVD